MYPYRLSQVTLDVNLHRPVCMQVWERWKGKPDSLLAQADLSLGPFLTLFAASSPCELQSSRHSLTLPLQYASPQPPQPSPILAVSLCQGSADSTSADQMAAALPAASSDEHPDAHRQHLWPTVVPAEQCAGSNSQQHNSADSRNVPATETISVPDAGSAALSGMTAPQRTPALLDGHHADACHSLPGLPSAAQAPPAVVSMPDSSGADDHMDRLLARSQALSLAPAEQASAAQLASILARWGLHDSCADGWLDGSDKFGVLPQPQQQPALFDSVDAAQHMPAVDMSTTATALQPAMQQLQAAAGGLEDWPWLADQEGDISRGQHGDELDALLSRWLPDKAATADAAHAADMTEDAALDMDFSGMLLDGGSSWPWRREQAVVPDQPELDAGADDELQEIYAMLNSTRPPPALALSAETSTAQQQPSARHRSSTVTSIVPDRNTMQSKTPSANSSAARKRMTQQLTNSRPGDAQAVTAATAPRDDACFVCSAADVSHADQDVVTGAQAVLGEQGKGSSPISQQHSSLQPTGQSPSSRGAPAKIDQVTNLSATEAAAVERHTSADAGERMELCIERVLHLQLDHAAVRCAASLF